MAPYYPSDWSIDRAVFCQALNTFNQDTAVYRDYRFGAPSTGTTPQHNTPPGSPNRALLVSARRPIPGAFEPTHFRIDPINLDPARSNTEQGPSSGSGSTSSTEAATTRNTSVEGEIQRNDRGSLRQTPNMAAPFSQAQADQMSAIVANAMAMLQAQQAQQPNGGTPPPDGSGGVQAIPVMPPRPPQFRARDIGYFDPKPDSTQPVEVKDNYNVYHNVFSFTARLQVKAALVGAAVLAQNLDACLLGAADQWFTNEIVQATRVGMQYDPNGISLWCSCLEDRFRDSPGKSLAALEAVRYTVKDTRMRKDPAEYMSSIVLNGKNSRTAMTEEAQVRLAFEHMDGELRIHLTKPSNTSTVAAMIKELRI